MDNVDPSVLPCTDCLTFLIKTMARDLCKQRAKFVISLQALEVWYEVHCKERIKIVISKIIHEYVKIIHDFSNVIETGLIECFYQL